ncbi:MAG: Gfo/Idh/MocA family oxidoreductase [Nitrospinaceae bacterium]|jgi:myo-inositol 2-dehydrogenase / D-chiro-inositol 1-dehydrogenase|nr:Gfo/Idh/MocA family oxidoreductase [Nitrospinaceae bacterium]MBT3822619.1 Gfo/Idh/MocA family oxidoreductase [Nitrospinaceae bacterium]MBT5947211.1 Gfo/Idh/MocA family oxidoreductase [Nitrospinaceae bacterium]MBT6396791.1 Gfo/Idh/MocA family oxidoreductase [Nitrospinaceae bacterium]MBT7856387.1 Gfo/Idh/MocA family oxidoreductase [Nitrospinaceae bacterium]
MSKLEKNSIGLAIVGCGRVGAIRGRCAREYPGTEWIGLCDIDEKKGKKLAEDLDADFFTTDYRKLLKRPEVNASVLATDEEWHARTLFASIEGGHKILVEKPLATNLVESAKVIADAEAAGAEILVGYTQRFRRRWLTAREHIRLGRLGDITTASTRAFVNQMVGITRLAGNEDRSLLSPMVISGTHALDASLFMLGDTKKPVEVISRAVTRTMAGVGTQDATFNIFTFDDGSIWSMDCSWGMPVNWPASTYSLTVGFIGTEGALTIDDTHADMVMATAEPLPSHRGDGRHVNFLGSYPAGDMSDGDFWGPMRDESNSWLAHIYTGVKTPHATGAEGQRNLMLTMACDLAAKRKKPVELPMAPEDIHAELTA